jgi:hypothetical protein
MKITTSLLGHLIRLYDKEEISLSRLAEMVNEKAEQGWTPTLQMPHYDGDYLCYIEKKEVCGAINYYQRVINCYFNQWIVQEGETVTHWQQLPQKPNKEQSPEECDATKAT